MRIKIGIGHRAVKRADSNHPPGVKAARLASMMQNARSQNDGGGPLLLPRQRPNPHASLQVRQWRVALKFNTRIDFSINVRQHLQGQRHQPPISTASGISE
jgi:hypothetical protein